MKIQQTKIRMWEMKSGQAWLLRSSKRNRLRLVLLDHIHPAILSVSLCGFSAWQFYGTGLIIVPMPRALCVYLVKTIGRKKCPSVRVWLDWILVALDWPLPEAMLGTSLRLNGRSFSFQNRLIRWVIFYSVISMKFKFSRKKIIATPPFP